jgi:hypothetical protein
VQQKVDEEVSGFMLGAAVFSLQGGQLTLNQEAQTVSGTIIGARIGRQGSGPSASGGEGQALQELERLLRLGPAPALGRTAGGSPGRPGETPVAAESLSPQATQRPSGLTCPNCHSPVQGGAKFCASCGNPLPAAPRFCHQCGAELAPGAKFCTQCGAST